MRNEYLGVVRRNEKWSYYRGGHIRDRSLFIPGVGTEEKRKTL